ncbi:hypothetical protein CHARACLAT_027280 [Characodon lateralis]|uniref:Uncharacterized protein n=1 Tax=Characodon lateralis TaxID=208331 RepID=A0ABU7F9L2_9TELE|nr:hypothetical protein [Characodon lateralis]
MKISWYTTTNTNPSTYFTYLSLHGHGGAGAYLQWSLGKKWDTAWTGHQSITRHQRYTQDKQPCTHTHTFKSKLETPINLTVMFLDCGRKLEYLERIHARSGRTCKLHVERAQNREQY